MLKISSMKTRLMLAIGGVSLVSTLCVGAYFIVSTVRDNHAQLATYRADLEESVGNQLKGETEVAYGILEEYYKKQQAGELTEDQAKKEAADCVRDLRYDGGKGYFWIDTVDGNNVVLLGRKDVEGTNRYNAKDPNGFPYIQEINKAAQQEGGGFTRWEFPKPGETESLPKYGYSIEFQPYHWVIGTGVWIDAIDAIVAQKEAKLAANLRTSILESLGVIVLLQILLALFARYIGANIARPIVRTTERLGVMGTGDFRLEGEAAAEMEELASRPDELGTMAQAMQEMNEKVRALMRNVAQTAEYLAASSEELTSSAEQAADVSQSIAESIVKVAGACSEQFDDVQTANEHTKKLTQHMQDFEGHLEETGQQVQKTSDVATEGRQGVATAVTGMQSIQTNVSHIAELIEGLGENSKQIGEIVDTIAGIAEQTNLLALNAAIEAARGGAWPRFRRGRRRGAQARRTVAGGGERDLGAHRPHPVLDAGGRGRHAPGTLRGHGRDEDRAGRGHILRRHREHGRQGGSGIAGDAVLRRAAEAEHRPHRRSRRGDQHQEPFRGGRGTDRLGGDGGGDGLDA